MKPQFCSQCGAPIESRDVDGRSREVCSRCGTVFYRNPLPVAAAVVLNERREVLLIRRRHEPHRGEWCLPMGFAELAETIDRACLRELAEEAGIQGRVVRLLDAQSTDVDPYGDLLIVSFEVEKTAGCEQAGDDAEAIAYFPPDSLPPLAFAANEPAIQSCLRAHQEQWAIQDSFRHIAEQRHQSMLSDALVSFISSHAGDIAEAWLQEVRRHPTTPGYAHLDPRQLSERARTALSQFSAWLAGDEHDRTVRQFYRRLGADRRKLGCGLHEVISSLSLLRKHILTYAMGHGVWDKPIDAYAVLEMDHRIILFFDKALYHVARGYETG